MSYPSDQTQSIEDYLLQKGYGPIEAAKEANRVAKKIAVIDSRSWITKLDQDKQCKCRRCHTTHSINEGCGDE